MCDFKLIPYKSKRKVKEKKVYSIFQHWEKLKVKNIKNVSKILLDIILTYMTLKIDLLCQWGNKSTHGMV